MESVQNFEEALERVGGDREFLLELLSELEASIPQILNEFAQHQSKRDAKALAKQAHTLKGMGSNLSLLNLTELCRSLESLANKEDWLEIENLLNQITQHFEEYKLYFQKLSKESA